MQCRMKRRFSNGLRRLAGAVLGALALSASAVDYRSVESATVLYDAPSTKGKKLFVIRRLTPVEVVVATGDWIKVRDADGGLAWIEKKALGDKRTVMVTVPRATVRERADLNAPVVFEAEKGVAFDLVETRKDGWAHIRHADGQAGFVRVTHVWGL